MRSLKIFVFALAIVGLMAPGALATNGMETLAWGARAAGMAGVDLAVATDATAINTNPAGLTQLNGHRIDFGAALMFPVLHYENDLNDEDGAFQVFPMPMISYAYSFDSVPVALGLGIFAQGGMGADFELVHPVLGKQDYNSQLAYMKIAPAVAYRPHKMISLGLAFNFGYAQMGMKMPFSVSPSMMKGTAQMDMGGGNIGTTSYGQLFGGMLGYEEVTAMAELENATALGYGGKFGILFMPHEMVSVGLTYTMETTLTFTGDATMNMDDQFAHAGPKMMDAFGAMPSMAGATDEQILQGINDFYSSNGINPAEGFESEYDAEIEFAWPQKVGLGIAVRPVDPLLIGLDVHWINWSNTMKSFKMTMKNGSSDNINRMMGSETVEAEIPLDWEDQITVSIGAEYEVYSNLFLRTGYNFGKNPVPDETVFPVFPAIVEHHVALGGGYVVKDFFSVNLAYELAIANTQKSAADHDIASEYDSSKSTLGEHTVYTMFSFDF